MVQAYFRAFYQMLFWSGGNSSHSHKQSIKVPVLPLVSCSSWYLLLWFFLIEPNVNAFSFENFIYYISVPQLFPHSPHLLSYLISCSFVIFKKKIKSQQRKEAQRNMGPVLKCGWYIQCHFTEENWFSFCYNYRLQIASWLGAGHWAHLLFLFPHGVGWVLFMLS